MVDTTIPAVAPLDWRIGIVDQAGRPTPAFQRLWNTQRAINADGGSVTLGKGVPPATPVPADGAEYVDISSDPFVLYVGSNGIWSQVGVVSFTDLKDAPHSYVGAAGQFLQVNGGATGLQFASLVGFSFNIGGRPDANEHLGSGVWKSGQTVTFENGQPYNIISTVAATSSTVLSLKTYVSGIYTTVATITFSAGGLIGVLLWSASTAIPPGTILSLWGPATQDATLAEITGLVGGSST